MRLSIRSTLVAALIIGMVAVPLVSMAGGKHRGGRGMGKGLGMEMGGPRMGMSMGQRLLGPIGDELGLTEAQRTQIQTILDEGQPRLTELRDQLRAAQEAFREGQDPATFDEAAIRAFAASQSQLKTDLMVEVARMRSSIHSVLTADQQQQLEDLRSTRGRYGAGRGGRGGAGGGFGTGDCPYGNNG